MSWRLPSTLALKVVARWRPRSVLMNAVPKEDFGGKSSPSHGHADPNLTYAVELVQKMGTNKTGS